MTPILFMTHPQNPALTSGPMLLFSEVNWDIGVDNGDSEIGPSLLRVRGQSGRESLLGRYYCTLTIRETILTINGSKIKGWWVLHHYISTVLVGIVLIWKDSVCYQSFRTQFLLHVIYICLVQMLQVQYQSGCLRRLHSLGQGHQMDITVEGFTSFMFKGLTFLLPFLIFGYFFQLYNAYVLWNLTYLCQDEWNVYVLCFLFFLLASGNIFTTSLVCLKKFRTSNSYDNLLQMTNKYRRRFRSKKEKHGHNE